MSEKKMLIVPAELVQKIDENRGDMAQADFISFLIDSRLKEEAAKTTDFATKEEIRSFEQDIKNLLRSFLDFFVSYGMDLGKQSPKGELEELASKLQGLESDLAGDNKDKRATIKWK